MTKQSVKKFSLKDDLFNAQKVGKIALEIHSVYPAFNIDAFKKEVLGAFTKLELKERIIHIRNMLKKYLPDNYIDATNILLAALPPELDTKKSDDDFGDFIYASYSDYVATYGCTEEYLDFSLEALQDMTKRFSVEYAIRDFINLYSEKTLAMLYACTLSENYHERRLASEGLRPKLPWAKKLILDYNEPLKHLDNLFYDNTRYVTRSVANHLNDIAKIDAPLVIETLKRWKALGKQDLKEMDYIINHALRTLVKRGDEDALLLLGYVKNPNIEVRDLILDENEVSIGDALFFNLTIEAKEDTELMVDYLIHFKTKLGTLSPKVHKLKRISLEKGEKITLKKKHPFKANMSTRTLYEGDHMVEVQINGVVYASDTFLLKM